MSNKPDENPHKHLLNFQLETHVELNAKIVQELRRNQQIVSKWVSDTRDQQTREALIKLGWTPPKEDA